MWFRLDFSGFDGGGIVGVELVGMGVIGLDEFVIGDAVGRGEDPSPGNDGCMAHGVFFPTFWPCLSLRPFGGKLSRDGPCVKQDLDEGHQRHAALERNLDEPAPPAQKSLSGHE